jgi:hypothetical protein
MIGGDLTTASERTSQLRQVRVRFNPIGVSTVLAQQPFEAQLFYTTVDGVNIALTKSIPLSITNAVTIVARLPVNFVEMRAVADVNPLFGIQFVNRANAAALSTTLYFTMESQFDLDADFNTIV